MVYLKNWDSFASAALELYTQSPEKVRYCVKWRHETKWLVLKVTDDTKCLKFKTRSAVFLNRFDAFNRTMIEKMQNFTPPKITQPSTTIESTSVTIPSNTGDNQNKDQSKVNIQSSSKPVSGVVKGGNTKKKGKKKK